MKHCEEYAALLSAFADGEVTETERDEILRHLDGCEGCSPVFRLVKKFIGKCKICLK